MKIAKTKNVKTPSWGTPGSAGLDFYIPEDFNQAVLLPHADLLIPSGIKCEVPKGFALVAFNKSGVATKLKLQVGACVVDSDYTGEIHLHVYNWSRNPIVLNPGDKLVQFVLLRYGTPQIELVQESEIHKIETERGDGGFGSTNKIEQEKPMIKRIPGKVAYVVKIDVSRESQKGGTYQRHWFRDVDNPNQHYILDVSKFSGGIFKHLVLGDTLMGLQTFNQNKKDYINGKSKAEYIGKIDNVKDQLTKKIGFTI